ncbi:MAG: hypothetical protein J3R72DRAFT_434336 [Linnemannia gamsii]|nr:MAG: hypothetical protein J3R72DRAFT_434336 [Linnemannia gamsii]
MQEMKVGPTSGAEHLLRRQQGQKMKLKEKFVEIYDMFLTGQDPAQGKDPEAFWDELFLIKVNEDYLASSLRQLSEDQLLAIKDGINNIFLHAVQTMRDPMPQRRLHAMQTLTVVLGEIFRKKFHNWSFDVIHLLTGLSHADLVFRTLLQGLCTILDSEESLQMQVVALRLAIALACGNDNVNKNSLNEYFMQKDMFPSLIKFFVKVESIELAFETMSLLGLLANYNKYETQNRYLASLAAMDDDVILRKMAMVITHTCDKMRKSYTEVMDDDEQSTVSKLTSAFSYVTGMLWNPKSQDISVTDEAFAKLPDGRITVLLVFYDLIYTNKRFLKVFLNYSTTSGDNQETSGQQQSNLEVSETGLGAFLSFSSYLLQHNRTHRSAPYTHLCLIIMSILVEDSASYPHLCSIPQSQDPTIAAVSNTAFGTNAPISTGVIRLCRQRQPVLPKPKGSVPMAAALLDVILGFLKHNMKKKMQVDCFRIAIAIIFNMAARFKALRVRLPYHWVEMWNTLQGLVKFLQANAKVFQTHPEGRDLVAETIDLVNYFVTFGDMIMPDPASLYALYYEIVRSGIEPFSDLAREFSISVQPALPAPLPHHDLTSRNRLNLASSPISSPPESVIGSPPPPGSVSVLGSPPQSPFHPNPSFRSSSPSNSLHGTHHHHQHQRIIILSLSNINQVYTFFFSHLLTWRDANPTRSLGPDLVSTIIKDHYQDLTLVPNTLDRFLTMRQNGTAGLGIGGVGNNRGGYGNGGGLSTHSPAGSSPVNGMGPHPAWDGYTEVPGKVYFFRQLTRWIVSDFRSISRQNASSPSSTSTMTAP